MSQLYAMDMVVRKKEELSQEEFKKIGVVYTKEWAEDTLKGDRFQDEEGEAILYSAEATLCGGESNEEAHNRIRDAVKEVVPGCSVTTRWTYLEDLPYEEFTD